MSENKSTVAFLLEQWRKLTARLTTSEQVVEDWWSIICRKYSEEWRFYHRLSHLELMLQLCHQWVENISHVEIVALAIFFHDIVYDPKSKDNEAQSVIYFKKFAKDVQLPLWITSRVSEMIEATESHSIGQHADDADFCLFLDFDLAILAQESGVYNLYAANIRREYAHFNQEEFNHGRTQVLNHLLALPTLFAHSDFRDQFEDQARQNMLQELSTLRM